MTQLIENKTLQWIDAAKRLSRWQIRLMELRYQGYGYKDISEMLNQELPNPKKKYTPVWLRQQLYIHGELRPQYDIYCEMMCLDSFEIGQNVIKSAHEVASRTMVGLLQSKYPSQVRLAASKEILDRNAGKATQKIEMEVDDKNWDEEKKVLKNIVSILTCGMYAREHSEQNARRAKPTEKEDSGKDAGTALLQG